MSDDDVDDLFDELKDLAPREKKGGRPPREDRIIAGFVDIQRFYEAHGRAPHHGEDRDIFERLYTVRLDRLRALKECRDLLAPLDRQGLLAGAAGPDEDEEAIDDDELLDELKDIGDSEISELRHVRTTEERRAADEVASREPCKDFEEFKPLFQTIKRDFDAGVRQTRQFQRDADIRLGEFFVLGGQMVYVAEFGKEFLTEQGRRNARLRLIFDNGTESRGLLRSFQRALYKDDAGRRITEPDTGPLFQDAQDAEGTESGTIYVLRSLSGHPQIAAHRDVIHKIGVTGSDVKNRIDNAELDPTFLLAGVEIVATYKLNNINRSKLENLLHRFFGGARFDIEIPDRFGNTVKPREWFLAPLHVIDEVVERIKDQTIVGYEYDPPTASLKRIRAGR
jgi:hypothetical protein